MKILKKPLFIALLFGLGLPLLVITLTKHFGSHESLAVAYGTVVFMVTTSIFMACGLVAIILEIKSNSSNKESSPLLNAVLFIFIGWNMVNGLPGAVDKVMEERFYGEAIGTISMGFGDEIEHYFGPISGNCSHVSSSTGDKPSIITTQLDGEPIDLCGIRIEIHNSFGYMLAPTKEGVKIRFGRWPDDLTLISSLPVVASF